MNGLSCFGNFSMGELGNIKNLSLNNPKLGLFKFEIIDAGKCVIPGFNPPQLPNFSIPPIPLFGGIPSFSLFCLLPPFPGIPGLSLPGISIPIPPIPFLPPIPLPIPGFSIPFLPLLPFFDLGSLSFLCGLLNIDLPVLDPFAGLNKLLTNLNGLIGSLNDFLNFCKENAEAINATETPPEVSESIAPSSPPSASKTSPSKNTSGFNVPSISEGDPKSSTKTQNSQKSPTVTFSNIKASPAEPATNMALYLANENIIPPEPSIINKAAALLAPLGTIGDLTEAGVQKIFEENNIPSGDGFIGFKTLDMDKCLEESTTLKEFVDCLIADGLLCNITSIISAVYRALAPLNIPNVSGTEVALVLNGQGIPYGADCLNLKRITADDVARAFFIRNTTSPLTAKKINNILVTVGVVEGTGANISKSLEALTSFTELYTPTIIENLLRNIVPGPSAGSLKAMCIAASRGINSTTLLDIESARSEALLQSTTQFKGSSFVSILSKVTLQEFKKIFNDIPFPFPLSVFDIIPFLAIRFEVDDAALSELFSNFKVPSSFSDIQSLYNFISFVAQTILSQQSALAAIQNCTSVQEGDFSFAQLQTSIDTTLRKYSITLPSDEKKNKTIANALQLENNFDYSDTTSVLGVLAIQNTEELAFLLLATGIVKGASQSSTSLELLLGNSGALSTPIKIRIQSPTRSVDDIDRESINVTVKTLKSASSGIIKVTYVVIQDGNSTNSTVAVRANDLSQVLEITILRIGGFNEAVEAFDNIEVSATFSTTLSSHSSPIPDNLISIKI